MPSRTHRTSRPVTRGVLALSAAALVAAALAGPAAATTTIQSATPSATGATYVALGDSYSSGEGNTPYEPGSDTSSDSCHRSTQAYGSVLAHQDGLSSDYLPHAGTFTLAACSGATTHDLFFTNGKYASELPQLDALGPQTKIVTLTIGGNDLGLTNWIAACLDEAPTIFGHPGPGTGEPGNWGCTTNAMLNAQTQFALNALAGAGNGAILRSGDPGTDGSGFGAPKLDQNSNPQQIVSVATVLSTIHSFAPNAHIYLSRYPRVFGNDISKYVANAFDHISGHECDVTPPTGITYDFLDATSGVGSGLGANKLDDAYAGVEQTAVNNAITAGIPATYVDPTSIFTGHANCDTKSIDASGNPVEGEKWINGISPTITGSFHPNTNGHVALAGAFQHYAFPGTPVTIPN